MRLLLTWAIELDFVAVQLSQDAGAQDATTSHSQLTSSTHRSQTMSKLDAPNTATTAHACPKPRPSGAARPAAFVATSQNYSVHIL